MKRLLLLTLLLILSACTPTEEPPEQTGCEEGQIEINDECRTLSGSEIQLYNTLTNMALQDNYLIDITISDENDNETTLSIQVDGSTSSFQGEVETTYYTTADNTCTKITERYDVVTEETIDCSNTSTIQFIHDFTYDMFTLSSGVYVLNTSEHASFQTMIDAFLTDATLNQVTLQTANNLIEQLTMDVTIDTTTYQLSFQFQQYGSVAITLPSE